MKERSQISHRPSMPESTEISISPRIRQALSAIAPQIEQCAWERLAEQLQKDGTVPSADARAVRRWLESSLGLRLEVLIRSTHEPVSSERSPRTIEIEPSRPSLKRPMPAPDVMPRSVEHPEEPVAEHPEVEAQSHDKSKGDRPTTTNPLALAVANFKGFRGIPADMKAKTRLLPRGR
jgi:hypothetical protein